VFQKQKIKMRIPDCTNYTGQQIFSPIRKNVCFWCIFGRWIQTCFQNFSVTHTFRIASDYVTAQAYVCESLVACRWYSGHVVTSRVTCHTRMTNSTLPVAGQSSLCYRLRSTVFIPPLICQESVYIHRMHSATSAVRWHSNPEDGLSHPWLRNII